MPALLKAAVLGIVQGLTEFLPISSTAHLLIGGRLLGFSDPGSVFTEMIQLGSMLAIMWIYRARLAAVVSGLGSRPEARRFALLILVAFVPAIVAGALFADYVEAVLHQSILAMAIAFIAGGLVMLAVEGAVPRASVHRVDDVSFGQAAAVGVAQVAALVPGVSRSGATIVGGRAAGLDRATAAEFSFFLAMPTLAAAFAHSVIELRDQITVDRMADISVGFVAAFLSSLLVVKPFLEFVRRAGFAPFAWYRIVVGAALLAALAAGMI